MAMSELRILLADNDLDFLDDLKAFLNRSTSADVECFHLTREQRGTFRNVLEHSQPDIILVNLDVDDRLEFGAILKDIHHTPFSIRPLICGISKHDEIHFKKVVYEYGIDDYLIKPVSLLETHFRLSVLIKLKSLQRQLESANKRLSILNLKLADANQLLQELTVTDELTGLYNMRFVTQYLQQQFTLIRRHPRPFSLMMIDLDHFKQVNDKNDHLTGSATIQAVGRIIRQVMRHTDIKARFGGDEYLVAMPETDRIGANYACERLLKGIREHNFRGSNGAFQITASLGVAVYDPDRHRSYSDLIKDADLALYVAKETGRNRHIIFDPEQTASREYDAEQSSVLTALKKVG